MITKSELTSLIMKVLPYHRQIELIESDEEHAVRFCWRGDKFRVVVLDDDSFDADEIISRFLQGSNKAILIRALIVITYEVGKAGKLLAGLSQ